VSLCLQQQKIEGTRWFQLQRMSAVTRPAYNERLQAQNLARKEAMQDCDHVWSSEFSELVNRVRHYHALQSLLFNLSYIMLPPTSSHIKR
jgi:hypothetical protein